MFEKHNVLLKRKDCFRDVRFEKNPVCHADGNDARPDENTCEVYMLTGASVEEFSQVFVLLCFCIIVMLSVIVFAVFLYG